MDNPSNFWAALPKPFFVLAPMEDVTDAAFRTLIASKGKPDVTFTEFTSGDGLMLAPETARPVLLKKLQFDESERPIVAQLFGSTPENMENAAALARDLGFDGLDINMGCPVKKIVDQGCGAALIRDHDKAKEIIRAAKRGAGDMPVSVKTRIGYNTNELDTWLPAILEEDVAVVTLHARTRKEMSKVPAHWDAIKQAVQIRDKMGSKTLIVGNGDVQNIEEAKKRVEETGCDGVMLGRAIYGNPWLFRELHIQRSASLRGPVVDSAVSSSTSTSTTSPMPSAASESAIPSIDSEDDLVVTPKDKIETLSEHVRLFERNMTGYVSFALMKKHFKAYISGWDGAKELRMRLMETNSPEETLKILQVAKESIKE